MIKVKKSQALLFTKSSQFVDIFNIYYRQDHALLPYIAWSSLFSGLSLIGFFYSSHFFCIDRKDWQKQVVDIELVSNTDFQDKQDLLPATKPKPALAKKTSPVVESRGELFTPPVFVIRAPGNENGSKTQTPERQKQLEQDHQDKSYNLVSSSKSLIDVTDLANRYVPLTVPFSAIPVKSKKNKHIEKSDNYLNIEEVKPPELVEIKENEGDNSNDIWQSGGRSSQGAGSPSSLAEYLKDLHRKLKHYWTPPSGAVHHIKVVFRLAKDGSLLSCRLINSSGNTMADNSALEAIKDAAPFGKLPTDYSQPFLDLAYTFNYTTDELTEIHKTEQDL